MAKEFKPVLNEEDMNLIDCALGEYFFVLKETAIERGALNEFNESKLAKKIKNLRTDLRNLRK